MAIPKSLTRLIEGFSKMPGIGLKSAERLAFYVLRAPREYADLLMRSITDVKNNIKSCKVCSNLSDDDLCQICSDQKRDRDVICVVENPNDIIAIEKTGGYNGRYFCLMGALSPLDGIGPKDLKIDKFLELIKKEKIKEVILATDSDQEGETTALYLARAIKPSGIKIMRIAFGIPVGSNIEYADQATLAKAFEGRRQF